MKRECIFSIIQITPTSVYEIVKFKNTVGLLKIVKESINSVPNISQNTADIFQKSTSSKTVLREIIQTISSIKHPFDDLPLRIVILDFMATLRVEELRLMNNLSSIVIFYPDFDSVDPINIILEECFDLIIVNGIDLLQDFHSKNIRAFINSFRGIEDNTIIVTLQALQYPCVIFTQIVKKN